ncbi:DUF3102 domain-containing protein [Brevibacillus agri]|uniref:DUF3102 domain-containing protein n=1 Tax=Brevibacillus TaxID=55080 RepID=UPI0020412EB9|nr:DUF3102 domain-containing protein [Brevibacillus borstelensis]MCM3592494.1 DUF3102 domain-containing protein [Brevibacillus borstelensis]
MRDVKQRLNPKAFKQSPKLDELSGDIRVISEEIQSYKQRVTSSIIEIGKRLKHVKENDLTRGRWLEWLASLQIEARQAQRFMQAFEQFGNTSASTHLESGKIIEMLTLPPEVDRAEFIEKKHTVPSTGEEKAVAEMTTRELREVVKEQRKAAGLVRDKAPSHPKQDSKRESTTIGSGTDYADEIQEFIEAAKRLHPDIKWAVFNCRVTIRQAILISTLPDHQQKVLGEIIMRAYEKFDVRFYHIFRAISKSYKIETIEQAMRLLEKLASNVFIIGSVVSTARMETSILEMMADDSTTEQTFREQLDEFRSRVEEATSNWRKHYEEEAGRFRNMFGSLTQNPRSDNPYKVLGLPEGSPFEEVTARYRSLMQVVHPDKGGSDYLFQSVKAAYDEIRAANKMAV